MRQWERELRQSHRFSENPRESHGRVRSGNGRQRYQARGEAVGMERTHTGVPVEWEAGKELVRRERDQRQELLPMHARPQRRITKVLQPIV